MEEINLFLLRPPQQEEQQVGQQEEQQVGQPEEQQVGQPEALQQPMLLDTGHCQRPRSSGKSGKVELTQQ